MAPTSTFDPGMPEDTAPQGAAERTPAIAPEPRLPKVRAEKAVQFQTDPTWRAYIYCYIEGLRLCRSFTAGDPSNFERLITEQLLPSDLAAAA